MQEVRMIKKTMSKSASRPSKTTYTTLGNRWHAVSVIGGLAPCPAAIAIRQKRMLSDEAPRLPLPECTSPGRCQCRYQHHTDRRVTLRRAVDRGGLPFPWSGANKRIKP